jgi:hypothetical protein
MMDLFDHAAAHAAKLDGMKRSEDNADESWSALMLKMVNMTCTEQLIFSADDVFERADGVDNFPSTHDTRAFGPVMNRAVKLGYCEPTDRVIKSRRPSNHHRPIALWRSNLYQK